jgi:hypothetical protein
VFVDADRHVNAVEGAGQPARHEGRAGEVFTYHPGEVLTHTAVRRRTPAPLSVGIRRTVIPQRPGRTLLRGPERVAEQRDFGSGHSGLGDLAHRWVERSILLIMSRGLSNGGRLGKPHFPVPPGAASAIGWR